MTRKTNCKLVALRRVSTVRQGESGLGLEAQDAAIEAYRQRTGCTLVKTYTEIESGTHDDIESRPELLKAIAHAKRANAVLVIAKLDRLVRSTIVMSALKEAKVRFIACDNPEANELTVDILVAVAANEARQISERTRGALAAAKARGVKLGNPEHLDEAAREKGRILGAAANRKKADQFAVEYGEIIRELKDQGFTLRQIAEKMNAEGFETPRGSTWTAMAVKRVLDRLEPPTSAKD